MGRDEAEYLSDRAYEERSAARRSVNLVVARCHNELANRYALRARAELVSRGEDSTPAADANIAEPLGGD